MRYTKLFVMVLVTGLTAIAAVLSGGITSTEWVTVAIAVVGSLSVFTAANVPGAAYTKAILAVFTAVLAFLVTAILGGIDTSELIQIAILAAGAVGVYAFPNEAPAPVQPQV